MVVGVVLITALPCSDELICPGSHSQSACPPNHNPPHPTHELARVALGTLAAACQTCCLAVAHTRRWYPQAACGHSQPPPVVTFLRAAAQHTTAAHLPRKNCPSTADSAESSPPAPGSSRKPPTNSKHARCTVGGGNGIAHHSEAAPSHLTHRPLAKPARLITRDDSIAADQCGCSLSAVWTRVLTYLYNHCTVTESERERNPNNTVPEPGVGSHGRHCLAHVLAPRQPRVIIVAKEQHIAGAGSDRLVACAARAAPRIACGYAVV